MLDVLVVGGGFWGSAIAARLGGAGYRVVCLDGAVEGGASRAAAGLVRARSWEAPVAAWWEAEHVQACREFFSQGWVDEYSFSAYAPQPRPKGQIWCGEFPWVEALPARVSQVLADEGGWRAGGWTARQLVLAAGCWCDELLAASGLPITGVRPAPGKALLARGQLEHVLTRTYRLTGDTRTRSMTVRNWSQQVLRLGDSLPEREPEQLAEMRQLLGQLNALEIGSVWGLRPRLARPLVELWAPGLVVATGGYRNGLAIAPGVALRVQQLLQH